jgi:hypothetical protein
VVDRALDEVAQLRQATLACRKEVLC